MTFDHNKTDVMRYIDSEMTDTEREAFAVHLESCVTCKKMLNDMKMDVMRYFDNEMEAAEREAFEEHIESCVTCKNMLNEMSSLKEVTDSMKIAKLPETVWEKYWDGVYNQLERSVAWFFFIIGSLILIGYSVYQVIIDFSVRNIVELGGLFIVIGFAILLLSVLREKITVNAKDRYISEVKR